MQLNTLKKFVLWSVISTCPIGVLANTNVDQSKVSKSISFQKSSALNTDQRTLLLKQAPLQSSNPQFINALKSNVNTAARISSFDYSIYDATTDLLNDDDYDGFYHRFSVTIDVDTLFNYSTVYADLYLSFEGGPWIYYASSQNYDIHSDSFNDAFTVETELADGYPTGYYNMKIKLYDSVTDQHLLTYDNLNDYSLSSIPLEDSYRDQYIDNLGFIETEIIISHGVGSMNLFQLLTLFVLIILIRIRRIFTQEKRLAK